MLMAIDVERSPVDSMPDISIREFIGDLRSAKWLVLALVAGFTIVGMVAGLVVAKKYEAEVVLTPASDEGGVGRLGALGALASQYSGLASLAGFSFSGSSKKEEAVAVLQSDLVTRKYIQENHLLPVLYPKLWDPATKSWTTEDPEKVPTLWKASQLFKKRVRTVVNDSKSGLITLTIRWTDPVLAAQWANDLVKLTNEYLRDKTIREAERNIIYLNEQASKTNIVGAQQAIYALLQEEMNKEMLARGRIEYALKVIDPAAVPEKPSSHGALFLGMLGFGMGCFIAVLLVFGRRVLQTQL